MTIRRALDVVFTDPKGLPKYIAPLSAPGLTRRYSVRSFGGPIGGKVLSLPSLGSANDSLASNADAPILQEQSGIEYMQFDGSNDSMSAVTSDASVGSGAYTVFVVGRIRSYPSTANWALVGSSSGGSHGSIFVTTSNVVSGYRGSVLPTAIDPSSGWHVFMMVCNGAGSVVRVDSTEVTGSLGTNAPGNLSLGYDNAGGTTARVDIIEAGFFGRALSSGERANTVTELKAMYGI